MVRSKKKNNFSKKKKVISNKSQSLKKNRKFFYIIRTNYLDKKKIKDMMGSRGIWEEFNIKNPQKEDPDFIIVDKDTANDKDLWSYKTKLKSQVDFKSDSTLENKFELVESLKKLKNSKLDKLLLEQHHVNLFNVYKKKLNLNKFRKLFNSNKVWIFKFIYGHAGKNIIVLDSFSSFMKFIYKVIKNNKKKWTKVNYQEYLKYGRWKKSNFLFEWVLQEYLTQPALFKNKKFHIRGYYLFYNNGNKKEGYIFHNSRIALANKEYENKNYFDKNIHDTHLPINPTKNVLNLNPHIYNLMSTKQVSQYEKDLKYLFNCITKINKVKCYSTDLSCYNVYGFDIMVTKDFKIKLIECNLYPGLPPYQADLDKINHPYHIFDGIIECIVDKKFKGKTLPDKENKFIQVF